MAIIDFQTFLLPETVSGILPDSIRRWGKFWTKPVSRVLHETQPWVRFLPPIGRTLVEEFAAIAPLSMTLFESSLADLRDSAEKNQIDRCVILSDPARVPNARLLEISEHDPMYIPGIRIPKTTEDPKTLVEREVSEAHERGCRLLQIHPASDGVDTHSELYQIQIAAATTRGWTILIQSGAPKVHLVYPRPEFSEITRFEPWFKNWPKTNFVVARMGFDYSDEAMTLAEQFENVYLETSWQPTETVAEAVRRIGSSRVIFGSDWPILGNNQRVALHRIRDAVESQMFSEADSEKILGENAARLLQGKA